jgi:signal transduction histidine kinase
MRPPSSVLHSTAFRFSIYFAGLFALIALSAGWGVYVWVSDEFQDRQDSYVSEMKDTLLTVAYNDGFNAARNVIARKARVSPEAGIIYLLTDKAGRLIAGNIDPIPTFEGTRFIPWQALHLKNVWSEPTTPSGMTASWTLLEDGNLLIGDDDGDIIEAQRLLVAGIVGGSAIITLIAAAMGFLLGLRAQRRIDAISEALDAAGKGQPHLRVARTRSGDDIDRIGGHVNSTLDQLQRVLASLRQVSADIAHDLKTPIGRIQRRLEELLETDVGLEGYRQTVTATLSEVEGIVETFEALLSIAQLEAGLKKQRFREVDLRDVLATLAGDYQPVAQEYGHELKFLDRPGHPVIYGDTELLTQLFANLVENSIRHCPPGARIDLTLTEAEGRIVFEITDNGPGIPKEEHCNVFRRLYRLEKSRTTPGHGLGLSLVSAIVLLHDGTIQLGDNKPGLTVTITFADGAPIGGRSTWESVGERRVWNAGRSGPASAPSARTRSRAIQ